ncbi:gliding motility-associated C-terminal domain-containing protein [Hymenobacter cheonanensis]|uniref:gliding motility-associated C-terminal domain-containing protein n=1 Tax=Hymenobacter sp. CA2-7 TaxID=3063993 RepID=UPI002712B55F|nr:gliding motility-associated C-terminal domain-containing protein [Hymenobacter sp. CA2-7]MDO7884903.1 gliding motility-associated C-terminal domain-containing protein [Hymenobacter sp. CA2-7]
MPLGYLRIWRRWLLLASLLLTTQLAWATHIVGGELDLQHQTGSTYTLTLTLYFDAINGNAAALDQALTAGVFDKATNRQLQSVVLPLTSNTFVSYTNPACAVGSLSTRKLVYTKDITLDAATYTGASGYYVAVERCCRNLAISNIIAPGAAAQTFYLEFPAVVRNGAAFIDSTPRIFPALGDYACLNNLFYYDFGGQDPDGDSLAYDMVTPLNGHATATTPAPLPAAAPYSLVTWTAGLSTTNQIPGAPALGIDAHTGRLTVRPSRLGLFVFGVRCAEYRKGVKIGETRRDFQLYVLNCPSNNPPVVTVQANGRAYRPGRDTVRLVPGGPRCLTLRYTDPDPNSTLTLTTQPVNFSDAATAPSFTTTASGTVRASGQPDTLSATLCFPECADTKGKVYLLNVLVADNGCSLPKRDTVQVAFMAAPPPSTTPVLTTSFPTEVPGAVTVVRVPLGQPYTATLLGTDVAPNPLALTATGEGFDLASVGMTFVAQNGAGRATATFTWTPACGAASASPDGLLVHFALAQSTTCSPHTLARPIRFVIERPTDTLAFRPPNIITPNGDGRNDVFTLPDLPPDFCDAQFAGVQIFSRWGRLMYQSPERSFSWGGAATAGTYFYLIRYTDGRKYKGWLEVLP